MNAKFQVKMKNIFFCRAPLKVPYNLKIPNKIIQKENFPHNYFILHYLLFYQFPLETTIFQSQVEFYHLTYIGVLKFQQYLHI